MQTFTSNLHSLTLLVPQTWCEVNMEQLRISHYSKCLNCKMITWIIWQQRNDAIFNKLQWPIEKTRQIIWDALHDCGRIEWKWMLRDLEKGPDVSYYDIWFDWEGGGSKASCDPEPVVITWKDRPHMCIISRFPLGLRCFDQVNCIIGYLYNWKFQYLLKREREENTMIMGPQSRVRSGPNGLRSNLYLSANRIVPFLFDLPPWTPSNIKAP